MELHTPDLVIRPPLPEDAPAAFELMNDPDVRRWNPTRDCPDLAAAEEWCRDGADWSDGTHASWHGIDRRTGRMVGNVSLFGIDTDDRVAKIGYRVLPAARGRGVARQLVIAVTEWAFDARGVMRVQLEHAVTNPASCRVALAAGSPSRARPVRRTPCRAVVARTATCTAGSPATHGPKARGRPGSPRPGAR